VWCEGFASFFEGGEHVDAVDWQVLDRAQPLGDLFCGTEELAAERARERLGHSGWASRIANTPRLIATSGLTSRVWSIRRRTSSPLIDKSRGEVGLATRATETAPVKISNRSTSGAMWRTPQDPPTAP